MKHKTSGLARPCNSNDLFLTSQGLQCGNCLAIDDEPRVEVEYSDYAKERMYQWHNTNGKTCLCAVCWPINKEKL